MSANPNVNNAGNIAPVTGTQPETVTAYMEGYFSTMQLKEMSTLGINFASLESPTFSDTIDQMELGFPSGLNLYPLLAPPNTSNTKSEPVEIEAYVLQKIISSLPQPVRTEVDNAIKGVGGTPSPMIADLVSGLKSYAVMYQNVMSASQAVPPTISSWLPGQQAAVGNVIKVTQAMTLSAGKVVDPNTQTGNVLISFLLTLSKDLLSYQNTMLQVEASNAQLEQTYTEVSQANTFAEMTAQQNVLWNDFVAMQKQMNAENMGLIGGGIGLIFAGIIATILAILSIVFTWGISTPAAIGIIVASAGLVVSGANMIAQGMQKPSLGSAIEKAIQQGGISNTDLLAISGTMMALSVALTIFSFGTLSFTTATATSLTTAVVTGMAGALGMEMMSQSFTDALTNYLESPQGGSLSAEKAAQDVQAIMGTIMALVVVAGMGKGLANFVKAVPDFFRETLPNILENISAKFSSATSTVVEDATEEEGIEMEVIDSAGSGEGGGGGGSGSGGTGGGGGGGGAAGGASGAASATTTITQTVSATAKVTQAIQKAIMNYGTTVSNLIVQAGGIVEAASQLSQYNVAMTEATVVQDQATMSEVQILTSTFSKMMQTAASTMTNSTDEISSQIASAQPIFNQVINAMSQAVSAITSNSASKLNTMQSASSVSKTTAPPPPTDSSSPPTKAEQEQETADMSGLVGQAQNAVSMFNTATAEGVSGKAMNTTSDAKQQIALAQLLNVLSDKISDMLSANGCDPRLAKKLAKDLAPAILRALLNAQKGKGGGEGKEPDMSKPMLAMLSELMGNKPMKFGQGSEEQNDITEKASKDPDLKSFMEKIGKLMNPAGELSPKDFASIVTELTDGILEIGEKGGVQDPADAPNKLLDLVMGEGASQQMSASMGLASSFDLGPALLQLLSQEENPFEQFARYSPA